MKSSSGIVGIPRFARLANLSSVLFVVLVIAIADGAAAQSVEPPLRQGGLFGTTRPDSGNRDRLNVLFDGSEALQSELPPDSRFRIGRGELQSGGYSSMLTTTTDYTRTRRRTEFAGTLLTSFKYYEPLDQVVPVSHSAGVGLTVRLPKQSTFQLNSMAAYAPAYLYQLFPRAAAPAAAEAIAADPDYRIDQSDSYSYGGNMTLAIGAPRKTRVIATGDYRETDFYHSSIARPTMMTAGSGLKLTRPATRHTGFSIGYDYRTGNFGLAGVTNEHRLTVGGEYSYALTASRRASLRFELAPALLDVPESVVIATLRGTVPSLETDPISSVNRRLYRLQGDARFNVDLGRTWRTTATYRRGVEYLAVLTEPVLADAGRVEVAGLITRRIDVSAAGGHATAKSALTRGYQGLKTNTGQLRVRFALTRSLAVYSQYLYYYYDLREQSRLAPDLPRLFEQHEVRAGFMLFVRPFGATPKGPARWPERTRPTKS